MVIQKNSVLVAMSGGVDSSVAAAMLDEAGHDCVGVTMRLFRCRRVGRGSCCSPEDRRDAAVVCRALGIPHHIVDCTERFRRDVIEPFVEAYLAGRTPSPCICCNEALKFGALMQEADRIGASHVATGHYARIIERDDGFHLLRSSDSVKDQSYFLYRLTQRELARLRFPLGEATKDEVRALACDRGLPVHEKPESQDICFVPGDDYAAFLEEVAGDRLPGVGEIVDRAGRVVGRHPGIHSFTIGQRRGLGVAAGERRYVVALDAARNRVVVGSDEELWRSTMRVEGLTWVHPAHAKRRWATVRVRSTHAGAPATLEPMAEGTLNVRFDEPVRAIAPGQAAVFSDGEEVLGGGWIAADTGVAGSAAKALQ